MFKSALRLFKGLREMAREPKPMKFEVSGFRTITTRSITAGGTGTPAFAEDFAIEANTPRPVSAGDI
jgi:hypothetical protein